jgi:ubiquinone/menaquinone biosynthesis C-methylase UbiE
MEQDKIWDYYQNEWEDTQSNVFPEKRQRFILRHIKPGQDVLNIGVGSGALERLGQEKAVNMYSLDPSQKTIERLRDTLGMAEKAQVGYAQAMPFSSGTFDVVVMSEVLEHLDDQILTSALNDVFRVLKPGGFLLATTPYQEYLGANQVVCPDCGKVFHKVGHVQSFDKDRMRSILEHHGYTVAKLYVTTFVDWQRKGINNLIKTMVRVLLARMGEGIADPHVIVIANKPLATAGK